MQIRNHNLKISFSLCSVVLFILSIMLVENTVSKSLFVIADINARPTPIQAYNIKYTQNNNSIADDELEYQYTSYIEEYGIGLAIDTVSNILFIIYENRNVIQLVDARSGQELNRSLSRKEVMKVTNNNIEFKASNLAGIVFDQNNQKVYTVDRNTNFLYICNWNPGFKITEENLDRLKNTSISAGFKITKQSLENLESESAGFKITRQSLENLESEEVPDEALEDLRGLENQEFTSEEKFLDSLKKAIGEQQINEFKSLILERAKIPKVPSEVLEKFRGLENQEFTTSEETFLDSLKKAIGEQQINEFKPLILKHAKIPKAFKITKQSLEKLKSEEVPDEALEDLRGLENQEFTSEEKFLDSLERAIGEQQTNKFKLLILKYARILGEVLEKLQSLENQKFTSEEKFLNRLKIEIGEQQTDKFKTLILKYACDMQLTPDIQKQLGNVEEASGIALDDVNQRLYVSDMTRNVKYFDINDLLAPNLTVPQAGSFTVLQKAQSIAVDPQNGFVYIGSSYTKRQQGLLSKYDINSGNVTQIQINQYEKIAGLVVDQQTGYLYVTIHDYSPGRLRGSDLIRTYDCALVRQHDKQTGSIERPTGIIIRTTTSGTKEILVIAAEYDTNLVKAGNVNYIIIRQYNISDGKLQSLGSLQRLRSFEISIPRDSQEGAVGLAVDMVAKILFITYEKRNVIHLVDAELMEGVGVAFAPEANNLAGIVVDHLDDVPSNLRQEFSNYGITLLEDASIETEIPSLKWKIDNGSENYIINKTGGTLGIYREDNLNNCLFNVNLEIANDLKPKIYTVDRNSSNLYVYTWNSIEKTLILDGKKTLGGVGKAYGIALDDIRNRLYVGDMTRNIKYFNTDELLQSGGSTVKPQGSYKVSQKVQGIAVDPRNGFIYTGNCFREDNNRNSIPGLLCKYDINAQRETPLELIGNDWVAGLDVDPDTSRLYLTTGHQRSGGTDEIRVYDSDLKELVTVGNNSGNTDIGDPTGIAVGVSWNPLKLEIDDNPDLVLPNGTIDYTISCQNNKGGEVNDVKIITTLSDSTNFVNATNCNILNGRTVEWNIGTLVDQESRTVNLQVQLNGTVQPGNRIYNAFDITSEELAKTTKVEETTVSQPLNLKISDNRDPVPSGETVIYTIDYDNPNDKPVHNVVITYSLPHKVKFELATDNKRYDPDNLEVKWTINEFSAGATGSVAVTVRVNAEPGTQINNVCTVKSDNTSENTANETTTVSTPSLIEIISDYKEAFPGETITYTIIYTNQNDIPLNNAVISYSLPDEVKFESATDNGQYDSSNHKVKWFIDSIPASGEKIVKLEVKIKPREME